MAFRIDFDKINKEKFDKLPEEEKQRRLEYKRLEQEHTYYSTEIQLVDKYPNVKYGEPIREITIPVKLYRDVNRDLTLADKILLEFKGHPWNYAFDMNFVNNRLNECKDETKQYGLCVDAGGEKYVKREDMLRIINECIEALKIREIKIVEDYYPSCTEMLGKIGWM